MNMWDNPTLEVLRTERRERWGRLTFDCFSCKAKGSKAYCAKGHSLCIASKKGTLALISVLKGRTPTICRTCPDFEGEDNEKEE